MESKEREGDKVRGVSKGRVLGREERSKSEERARKDDKDKT